MDTLRLKQIIADANAVVKDAENIVEKLAQSDDEPIFLKMWDNPPQNNNKPIVWCAVIPGEDSKSLFEHFKKCRKLFQVGA